MVMRTREYIQYGITGPFMNRSVPENQVAAGSFGELVGVDGRYNGCLRKFYGMNKVVDLDGVTTGSSMADIDTYDGPSFFKYVTFHKRGTADTYRGFVVRWDKYDNNNKEEVSLVWTLDGSTWAAHQIWAGAGTGTEITSSLEMDCASDEGFLYVFIDGKSPKTIYYTGSALATVDMGPGAFSATLGALTAKTDAVDSSYNLRGNGTFQVAWRFYDSTRGIYSALSDPITITLDHMKTTKATGTVSFNSGGANGGMMEGAGTSGDIITINGRTYEYIGTGSDVTIAAATGATIAEHAIALADAINGDASAVVTARAGAASVLLESKIRGATGNAYTLSVTEIASNDDISVSGATFSGGGVVTAEPEEHCKATLDFPAHGSVVSGQTWATFSAMFDTVDIFRTIDLGSGATATAGAIFWLEQTKDKNPDWDTDAAEWDALTVTIGTKVDESLPFQTMYNPETDIVSTLPSSGAVGRYQGITFAGGAATTTSGLATYHSSLEHKSGEYFTTFNKKEHEITEGRPLRYLSTGDSMFILCPNAVTHVFKSASTKPLQFVTLHQERGLIGKEAAHVAGNSIFMISGMGLVMLNGADGSMGQVSAVNRLLSDDWAAYLGTIKSGYDALMNASFFLCSDTNEILQVYHSTQSTNILEGANFVGATSGPDVSDGKDVRAYFITKTGLIVVPDATQSGTGTMWGLDAAYTVNGTTTGAASKTSIVDSGATFHADMKGALLYCTSGDNAGGAKEITAVNVGNKTLTVSAFTNNVATGDRYAIAPVPFKIRLWPLRDPDPRSAGRVLQRWLMVGLQLKVRGLSGFTGNDNNKWRIGVYRNSGSSIESGTTELDIDSNPADSAASLSADGIDLEPYIEQIAAGVSFELTNVEVNVAWTGSREVTA